MLNGNAQFQVNKSWNLLNTFFWSSYTTTVFGKLLCNIRKWYRKKSSRIAKREQVARACIWACLHRGSINQMTQPLESMDNQLTWNLEKSQNGNSSIAKLKPWYCLIMVAKLIYMLYNLRCFLVQTKLLNYGTWYT
jgi:hypothetical protein